MVELVIVVLIFSVFMRKIMGLKYYFIWKNDLELVDVCMVNKGEEYVINFRIGVFLIFCLLFILMF